MEAAGHVRALHAVTELLHVVRETIKTRIGLEDELIAGRAEIDQVGGSLGIEVPVDEADQSLGDIKNDGGAARRAKHETNLPVIGKDNGRIERAARPLARFDAVGGGTAVFVFRKKRKIGELIVE